MSKLRSKKLLALLIAVSAVVIVAGIVLYALLGFNTAQDLSGSKVLEVTYSVNVASENVDETNTPAGEVLETQCEALIKAAGLSYSKEVATGKVFDSDGSNIGDSYDTIVSYTLNGASDEQLATLKEAIVSYAAAPTSPEVFHRTSEEVSVTWYQTESVSFNKAAWRGAIALAVGAIVALGYLTIRFGVSCGVAGLVCCAHDALFTLAFFAITRIPVYSFAPLLYAAIAAFVSVAVWAVLSVRIRTNIKSAEFAGKTGTEIANETVNSSWKYVLIVAGVVAAVIAVFGIVAASGTRALVLPALLAAAVPAYSALFIGPAVYTPVRKAFDDRRAAKKGGYVGKKKKAELSE